MIDNLARIAHAHRVAHPGGKHAPESCPCRAGHDYSRSATLGNCTRCSKVGWSQAPEHRGCVDCDPLLVPWEQLTEPQRDVFREQAAPFIEAMAVTQAREVELRHALNECVAFSGLLLRKDESAEVLGLTAAKMAAVHAALAAPSDRSALDALLAQARAEAVREIVDAVRATMCQCPTCMGLKTAADRVAPGWRGKETGR